MSGEGVAQALTHHFQATLNVPTQVAPQLLAAIPTAPTSAAPPSSKVAAMVATPPLAGLLQLRPSAAAVEAKAVALNELPPTTDEVREALGAIRNTSSPGADGLGAGLLKLGDTTTLSRLHRVIEAAWAANTAPTTWKQVLMVARRTNTGPLPPSRGVG